MTQQEVVQKLINKHTEGQSSRQMELEDLSVNELKAIIKDMASIIALG